MMRDTPDQWRSRERGRWSGRPWRVVCLLLILVLAGCGEDEDSDPTVPATTDADVPADTADNGDTPVAPTIEVAEPDESPVAPSPDTAAPGDGTAAVQATPQAPPMPTLAPTQTATPFVVAGAEIGGVVWTTAVNPDTLAPATSLDQIPSSAPVIFAAVPLTQVDAGTVISATWIYNGTPIPDIAPSVTVEQATQGIWVAFRLDRDQEIPWPDGPYEVVVSVNGEIAQRGTIDVRDDG